MPNAWSVDRNEGLETVVNGGGVRSHREKEGFGGRYGEWGNAAVAMAMIFS